MQVSKLRRVSASVIVLAAVAIGLAACQPPDDWYAASPSVTGRANGDVLQTYDTNFGLNTAVKSTAVMYRSTDALGQPDRVTGTILVPTAAWAGTGPRPIVSFASGTVGLGDGCAPSKAITTTGGNESAAIQALLDKGWAVAVTDYQGMGTPGDHTYVIKDAEAHAVLDIVRAAQRLPGSGIAANAPVALMGYSQGGQASAAAAELESTYAQELNVVGTAAGGVPTDLMNVATYLNGPGSFYFSFLAFAAVGLNAAYPELNLESYLNDAGKNLFASGRNACLIDGVLLGLGQNITNLTTTNPLSNPTWQARINQQRLGLLKPAAPVLLYHASSDDIIPFVNGTTLRDAWCTKGARVKWTTYDTNHLGGITAGTADAIAFLDARINNQAITYTCN